MTQKKMKITLSLISSTIFFVLSCTTPGTRNLLSDAIIIYPIGEGRQQYYVDKIIKTKNSTIYCGNGSWDKFILCTDNGKKILNHYTTRKSIIGCYQTKSSNILLITTNNVYSGPSYVDFSFFSKKLHFLCNYRMDLGNVDRKSFIHISMIEENDKYIVILSDYSGTFFVYFKNDTPVEVVESRYWRDNALILIEKVENDKGNYFIGFLNNNPCLLAYENNTFNKILELQSIGDDPFLNSCEHLSISNNKKIYIKAGRDKIYEYNITDQSVNLYTLDQDLELFEMNIGIFLDEPCLYGSYGKSIHEGNGHDTFSYPYMMLFDWEDIMENTQITFLTFPKNALINSIADKELSLGYSYGTDGLPSTNIILFPRDSRSLLTSGIIGFRNTINITKEDINVSVTRETVRMVKNKSAIVLRKETKVEDMIFLPDTKVIIEKLDPAKYFDSTSPQFCNANNVDVRSSPELDSNKLFTLNKNDEVKVSSISDSLDHSYTHAVPWYKINFGNKSGWVLGTFITPKQEYLK